MRDRTLIDGKKSVKQRIKEKTDKVRFQSTAQPLKKSQSYSLYVIIFSFPCPITRNFFPNSKGKTNIFNVFYFNLNINKTTVKEM